MFMTPLIARFLWLFNQIGRPGDLDNSYPRQLVPRTIRTQGNSYPGQLVPKTTRTQDNSYPRQLVPRTTRTQYNSYPGQLVPRTTRTQYNSYPGQLVPRTTRTLDNSYPGQLVPRTTRTQDNSYPGQLEPKTTRTHVVWYMLYDMKLKYYEELFTNYQNDTKKTWQTISEIVCKSNKNRKILDKIIIGSKTLTDKQVICDKFNELFANVVPKLASEITPQDNTRFKHYLTRQIMTSFSFTLVTYEDVNETLLSLRTKTSTGIDGISVKLLIL